VNAEEMTTGYIKTTVAPDGPVVSVKYKFGDASDLGREAEAAAGEGIGVAREVENASNDVLNAGEDLIGFL
jgi:hypothetical protein